MNVTKPKPTAADYQRREAFRLNQLKGDEGINNNLDELEFLNSIDWSTDTFEENGKHGLINAKGEKVLPALFDDFLMLTNAEVEMGNRVVAMVNGKYGVVLADGIGKTWVLEPEYDYIGYPNSITHVEKDGKFGVFSFSEGRFLIPADCDIVYETMRGFMFSNGIGFYQKNGKQGVVCDYGQFTDAIFDEVEGDCEGWVKVRIGEEWGYIDENNQFTTDEDEASYYYET